LLNEGFGVITEFFQTGDIDLNIGAQVSDDSALFHHIKMLLSMTLMSPVTVQNISPIWAASVIGIRGNHPSLSSWQWFDFCNDYIGANRARIAAPPTPP
jgi:hypothetical protein